MALRRERYLYEIFENRGQLEKADGKKCCAVYNIMGSPSGLREPREIRSR